MFPQAMLKPALPNLSLNTKDHLYMATTKRSYLTMPNTLNRHVY